MKIPLALSVYSNEAVDSYGRQAVGVLPHVRVGSMLFKVFADAAVPIRCRGCDARFTKVLQELLDQPEFACPRCDDRFDASAVVAELKQAVAEREPCHAGSDGKD